MTLTKERWAELCRQAARERDPEKLARLNNEINSILQHAATQPSPSEKKSAAKA